MSLQDRFRHAFDTAIADVRTRLESEFAATLTDARADADREKAEALAALENAKAGELTAADESRQAALAAAEETKLAALAAAEEAKASALAALGQEKAEELAAALAAANEAKVAALAELEAEKDRERAAALAAAEEARANAVAEARVTIESELRRVFEADTDTLVSNHSSLLSQMRETSDTDAARVRQDAEAALQALRLELQQAQDAASRSGEDIAAARAEAKQEADRESAASLEQARHEAAAELTRVQDAHEAALTEVRREAQAAASAHSLALEAQLNDALRLLESVRLLDAATSLTDVLDGLTSAAAKEAGRSAMLVVKGERLVGWRASGFGQFDDAPRSMESSMADVGALAAAVNTSRPAVVGSGSVLAAPAFAESPADRPGLAVPLLVAGRPVAVLYADPGASGPLSPAWASTVEVQVRHAGRCLEAMAVARGVQIKSSGVRVGSAA